MKTYATTQTPLADKIGLKTASQIRLKSYIDVPLSELSERQRSLVMAEASMIAYLSPEECDRSAVAMGFEQRQYFEGAGAFGCWFQTEFDSILVFRGVEATRWDDIQADARALTTLAETVGKVHQGFKFEADRLWPAMEEALRDNKKPLWFGGHSIGGALATICAGRCLLSAIHSEPEELHTFGSPRVGSREYVKPIRIPHHRWVNGNDLVPRLPPVWLGYRHDVPEKYLNQHGKLEPLSRWRRFRFGLIDWLRSVFKRPIVHLPDHAVVDYVERIFDLLRAQGSGPPRKSELPKSEADSELETNQEPDE